MNMKKIRVLAVVSAVAIMVVLSTSCKKKNPAETIMNHNVAIAKILKDNSADCEKAVVEMSAYIEKNKASFEEAKKGVAEAASKPMSEEETKLHMEKAKEVTGAMTDFAQKCPEQIQKVSEIYAALFAPNP